MSIFPSKILLATDGFEEAELNALDNGKSFSRARYRP
jgi:hypothetical protein